ncbi:hypothetical protein [Rhodopseudomonas palustris]|uniref:hypothetical protein n=1 Tax=Rhodopseudomonas palustris TaxID=1076 RepID=UPI0021F259AE|nr:hypothetical protein [Rhodopseudomonas palustris]UYO55177.1 hypothetical protein KQX61_07175 [Rhodopseudomonas palustris]
MPELVRVASALYSVVAGNPIDLDGLNKPAAEPIPGALPKWGTRVPFQGRA